MICERCWPRRPPRTQATRHVVADGGLDAPGMRTMKMGERYKAEEEAPGSILMAPVEVAKAFLYLAEQHPSVWTHEIALTPYAVKLGQRL